MSTKEHLLQVHLIFSREVQTRLHYYYIVLFIIPCRLNLKKKKKKGSHGISAFCNYDNEDDESYVYQGDYGDNNVLEFCDTGTGISEVDHISAHFYYQQDTSVMTGNKSASFLSKNKRSPALLILKKAGAMSPRHKYIKKHCSPTFIPEYTMDT